jgi:hypothetical protein
MLKSYLIDLALSFFSFEEKSSFKEPGILFYALAIMQQNNKNKD